MTDEPDEPKLFEGLKVLDVGTWIAGPVSTTILADYGADVIKVEIPEAGDAYRRLATAPGTPNADINYAWMQDARNKRSLTLNLKTEAACEILKKLVADCDVYVTNQPHPVRRRFGLTYEDLEPINPRVIYASLTAYGEKGPEADREGFDLVAYWSRTGLMDLVRAQGAPPAQSLPGMGDHPTAVALYASIVTALLRREKTGKGSHVHTSLIANGLWSASCIAAAKFANGDFSNYRTLAAKYFTRELYETADGRFLQFTMVRSEDEVAAFFTVLGVPELLNDPRFATTRARIESGSALAETIRPTFATHTGTEWMTAFHTAGVPVSMVGKIDDLPDDPQLAVNHIVTQPVDQEAEYWVINHPVNVDDTPRAGVERAPEIGEHTEEILADLGYSSDDISALRGDRAI